MGPAGPTFMGVSMCTRYTYSFSSTEPKRLNFAEGRSNSFRKA